MLTSLIMFFITGLIFAGLALPLIKRKIALNSWYGIRIPQTMQNENVWYDVNAIMGKYIFLWGLFISGLSVYLFFNPLNPEYLVVYLLLAILIFGSIFLVIISYRVADRISLKNNNNKL